MGAREGKTFLAEVDRAVCLFGGDGRLNINLFTEQGFYRKCWVNSVREKKCRLYVKNQRSEVSRQRPLSALDCGGELTTAWLRLQEGESEACL